MTEYALYVESGPKRRKTMVHILDLLGCIAQGPTTDDALDATPDAIRAFLRFLRAHGEPGDPEAAFTTVIAEHVMEGVWLGQGNPTPGFRRDFEPLSAEELAGYLQRLRWMRQGFSELIGGLTPDPLLARPGTGRPIFGIIEHVVEADCAYLRSTVGKVDGLLPATKAVLRLPDDLPAALDNLWAIGAARLAAMTEDERTRQVAHGQSTWTARRGLRRMLEHQREHLVELSGRLGAPVA